MLNLELLLSSAGDAAVSKAQKPSLLNKVAIVSANDEKVVARVKGTETYNTSLIIIDNKVARGSCNCMAFSSNSFCKHCVAVGLVVNAQQNNDQQSNDLPHTESHQVDELGGNLSADEKLISQYLSTLSKAHLIEQLMSVAQQENGLYEQLLTKAQFKLNPPTDKDIKKLITKALPNRQLWEYHKVDAYFNNAEASFKLILDLLNTFSDDKKIQLLEKFLDRFNLVMAKVDDSYGARFGLESEIKRAFDTTLHHVGWTTEQKGTWLFKQFTSDADIGLDVPKDFTLTTPVHDAFLQCCAQEFDHIEVDNDLRKRQRNYQLHKLSLPLVAQAKAQGDVYAQVKILSKTASSLSDVLNIGQLYLEQQDEISADDWLLKAKGLIATELDKRYWYKSAIDVALAEKNKLKARKLVWQMFNEHPTFNEFVRLEKVANKTASLTTDELLRIETIFIEQYKSNGQNKSGSMPANTSNAFDYYLHVNKQDKAIEWAEQHKVETYRLLSLANKISQTQPKQAINFYARAIDAIVKQATNSAYADAIDYLKELAKQWTKGSERQSSFTELLAIIITAHKNKRNLMSLIAVNFSQYL